MITFLPLENPTYPSNAALEAEERAHDRLARQIAVAGAVATVAPPGAGDASRPRGRRPGLALRRR